MLRFFSTLSQDLNNIIDRYIFIILLVLLFGIYILWELYKKYNSKKKYIYGGLLIFIIPITMIPLLKTIIFYLPGTIIGSIDGWLGFLGGYTGSLVALGGIWWQINHQKKEATIEKLDKQKKEENEYVELLKYILRLIEKNLKFINYDKDKNLNSLLLSLYSYNKFIPKKEDILYYQIIPKHFIEKYSITFLKKNHLCILELDLTLKELQYYQSLFYNEAEQKRSIYKLLSKKVLTENERKLEKNNEIVKTSDIFYNFLNLANFLNTDSKIPILLSDSSLEKPKEELFWTFYKAALEELKKISTKSLEDTDIYIEFSKLYQSDCDKKKVLEDYIYHLTSTQEKIKSYI